MCKPTVEIVDCWENNTDYILERYCCIFKLNLPAIGAWSNHLNPNYVSHKKIFKQTLRNHWGFANHDKKCKSEIIFVYSYSLEQLQKNVNQLTKSIETILQEITSEDIILNLPKVKLSK